MRVICEVKPNYIVLENVEGFMDMQFLGYKGVDLYDDNGKFVEEGQFYPDGSVTPTILRSELNRIGYDTLEPRILNAADYGVPQRRNRVIFIGYRRDLPAPSYPEPTVAPEKQLTLKEAISDLVYDANLRNKAQPAKAKAQKYCRIKHLNNRERFSLF